MVFSIPTAALVLLLPALSSAQGTYAEPDPVDASSAGAEGFSAEGGGSEAPVFVSLAPNINDFGRFADGGSDSNWYIGFNNAWIVKLPPVPPGPFARAFIGAKIGRAKTRPKEDRPWELAVEPGKIYIAVSQTPSFSSEQSFFLTETGEIPLQAHESIYLRGAGASEWFWTEVPPAAVSKSRPNYLIVWSPSREFREATRAPILAGMEAAPGESPEPSAWNNHSIQGVPPRKEEGTLQVPINIRPALAIKLVPAADRAVRVGGLSGLPAGENLVVSFSVEGTDVEAAWVESSQDELEWRRVSPLIRRPPYAVTIPRASLSSRGAYLRAKARDMAAVEGESPSIFIPPNVIR